MINTTKQKMFDSDGYFLKNTEFL